MDRPEECAKECGQTVFAKAGKEKGEEGGVGRVEKNVGQMKTPWGGWRRTEEEYIKRIGTPEERGEGRRVERGKGGMDRGRERRGSEHGVGDQIEVVVQIDEGIPDGGGEDGEGCKKCHERQKEAAKAERMQEGAFHNAEKYTWKGEKRSRKKKKARGKKR